MVKVAYLANQFPAAVEPYVKEEVEELRRRGVQVIAGSVRRPEARAAGLAGTDWQNEILFLQPVGILTLLRALALAVRRWRRISCFVTRVLLRGKESPGRRLKALLHTWLGACYAVRLRKHEIDHIHAHHGYFASWIAMVAARLLDVSYSLTLHGSDLLIDGAYLDIKLKHCRFCATISEYNRRYTLEHFPVIAPGRVAVSRLGVDLPEPSQSVRQSARGAGGFLTILAVGRLHPVKDHEFLIRACVRLRDCGLNFECLIAGDGPERRRLELLIRESRMQDRITLLGHVERPQLDSHYRGADVVVLTSRSEGIPLVLMEAMVRSRIVLAPAITGIPEIVIPGKTGFLYAPGIMRDFVEKVLLLHLWMRDERQSGMSRLDWMRHAARVQILHNFNRRKNLSNFGDRFLEMTASSNSRPRNSQSGNSQLSNSQSGQRVRTAILQL